jgi:hypothetical protein
MGFHLVSPLASTQRKIVTMISIWETRLTQGEISKASVAAPIPMLRLSTGKAMQSIATAANGTKAGKLEAFPSRKMLVIAPGT